MNCKQKRIENQALITAQQKMCFQWKSKKNYCHQGKSQASTWKELDSGQFDKNDKLSFISDNMLIVGCDIGSETHYVRAIDTRGRELSKEPFSFSNSKEGFESARRWMLELAAINNKDQIVMGLEPTGHYWFCIACWMISHGITLSSKSLCSEADKGD
ncbi:MAG: IS110 family transposase [bacterium LCO1.1]|uniref:IS110 family transposase n=1 Tax=Candidatus Weimeria bifida TaxID=2599074 RepID=A0A6N7IYS6_9FIRM|nr:IS110 family transposase [Candidatus Weimeria bifida]